MKPKIKKFSVLLLSLLVAGTSCTRESEEKEGSSPQSLSEFIADLEDPVQKKATGHEQIGDVLTEIDEETNTVCECTKYKASENFSEIMLLDPTSSVVYPGSIIEGNSVLTGSYRQIVLPRKPLNLSTNLQNFNGSCTTTVEEPTLSNVRSAIKEMIYDTEQTGSTSAKMTFEIEEVHSAEQLNLAIGASVDAGKIDLTSKFDFNSRTTKSRFLVKFIQVYYTIDVDAPSSPTDFFADNVTASDLSNAIGGNTVPVYVSSVQYGRIAYYCMESSERGDSVKANLEIAIKMGVEAKSTTNLTNNSYLKNMKVSGTIIGGSGEDAVQSVTGMDGLIKYITSGGNYTKESPGAPIAFTLTRLSNNEVFNVVNSSEYVARICKSTEGAILPVYIRGLKGNNDLFGSITAQIYYDETESGSPIHLFYRNENNYLTADESMKVDLDQPNNATLYIDYEKFSTAQIGIKAELYEYDKSCGCEGRTNNDKYNIVNQKFLLNDIINKSENISFDGEGNVLITITCSTEHEENHQSCGFLGLDTKHEPSNTTTNNQVVFAFKVNLD